jgi:hypothetical protein
VECDLSIEFGLSIIIPLSVGTDKITIRLGYLHRFGKSISSADDDSVLYDISYKDSFTLDTRFYTKTLVPSIPLVIGLRFIYSLTKELIGLAQGGVERNTKQELAISLYIGAGDKVNFGILEGKLLGAYGVEVVISSGSTTPYLIAIAELSLTLSKNTDKQKVLGIKGFLEAKGTFAKGKAKATGKLKISVELGVIASIDFSTKLKLEAKVKK